MDRYNENTDYLVVWATVGFYNDVRLHEAHYEKRENADAKAKEVNGFVVKAVWCDKKHYKNPM